jgi:cysteine dioxygenase
VKLYPGETAYISDQSKLLHSVRASACSPTGGVSLHLYSPPIRRCCLYEPEENRVTLRAPGFFSVAGELVEAAAHIASAPAGGQG